MQFLGTGARSTIWQVRSRETNEVFALKRVVKRNSSEMRYLEQAINEYEIGRHLQHENIRRVIDLQRIKRWMSLREVRVVMEYCEGKSVQQNRPTSIREVVRIFAKVGAALAYMNEKQFVHADTKPNNIIVAPDGTVKVIDLGQSCPIGTVKSRIQGTPDFIAPEQVRRGPVNAQTDVFNFGASLYWTAVGRPIPTVLPREGSLTMNDGHRVTPPEQLNPDIPKPLSKLIADCIQVSPEHRPRSMNEVASRLNLIHRQLVKRDQERTAS